MDHVFAGKGLGFIPGLHGEVRAYSAVKVGAAAGPAHARNVLSVLPPRRDQGAKGSCVGQTKRSQIYVATAKRGNPFSGSALDVYYFARAKRGWQDTDSGCIPPDANYVLKTRGILPESLWEQDNSMVLVRPPKDLDAVAERHQALEFADHSTFDEACAATDADEAGGAAMVWHGSYDSAFVSTTGVLPDVRGHSDVRGGHETTRVGYDAEITLPGWHDAGFHVQQNSWGEWGTSLVDFYAKMLGDDDPYVNVLRATPGAELRAFFFLPKELVDSEDVDSLDSLVDVEAP